MGGVAKGGIRLGGGRTIVERLIDELAAAGVSEVILLANDPAPYLHLGRPIVPDLHAGIGPLAGIEAALGHFAGAAEAVVLLPCDLPGVTAAEIAALKRAYLAGEGRIVLAETGENFWHPLCSVVHIGMIGEVSSAIAAGEWSVRRLWRRLGAAAVHFAEEDRFFNLNAPADLADWRARHEETR